MLTLKLVSDEESEIIFGGLESLLPPHVTMVNRIEAERDSAGCTHQLGPALLEWVSMTSSNS